MRTGEKLCKSLLSKAESSHTLDIIKFHSPDLLKGYIYAKINKCVLETIFLDKYQSFANDIMGKLSERMTAIKHTQQ